jgi:hypothetical protein
VISLALPSTATARRRRRPCPAAWPAACSRAPSQDPTAASSRSASTASSTRRMVASSGGTNRRASGSRRTPRAARTCGGASATHSPTAVNDVAPASTAATAAINNDVRLCPTPRRFRGSGCVPNKSSTGCAVSMVHCNGTNWTPVHTPAVTFWDVSALSATDAVALAFQRNGQMVLLRWNRTTWT